MPSFHPYNRLLAPAAAVVLAALCTPVAGAPLRLSLATVEPADLLTEASTEHPVVSYVPVDRPPAVARDDDTTTPEPLVQQIDPHAPGQLIEALAPAWVAEPPVAGDDDGAPEPHAAASLADRLAQAGPAPDAEAGLALPAAGVRVVATSTATEAASSDVDLAAVQAQRAAVQWTVGAGVAGAALAWWLAAGHHRQRRHRRKA